MQFCITEFCYIILLYRQVQKMPLFETFLWFKTNSQTFYICELYTQACLHIPVARSVSFTLFSQCFGKCCRPRKDATECRISLGSALIAIKPNFRENNTIFKNPYLHPLKIRDHHNLIRPLELCFLISQTKHMLLVLKKKHLNESSFEHPKTC